MRFTVLLQLLIKGTLALFMFDMGVLNQEVPRWIRNSQLDHSSYKALSKVPPICTEDGTKTSEGAILDTSLGPVPTKPCMATFSMGHLWAMCHSPISLSTVFFFK